MWILDFIIGMMPPNANSHTLILVSVCPFTKWVQAGTCVSAASAEVAQWVHANIVTRFGKSAVFRVNRGTEFAGEDFHNYCRAYKIKVRRISPTNSHA